MKKYNLAILVILDGWGIGPPTRANAVEQAETPVLDNLIKNFPATTLQASGEGVGLPWKEMGNSEVGHLNLGAGRIIFQSLPRINNAIESGDFFKNKAFLTATDHVKKHNSRLHLMGLVSPGGVHSHSDHLYALLALALNQGVTEVFVHAFLDGRDTDPQSGLKYLEALEEQMRKIGVGRLATIAGRFFAMDRDQHWERTKKSYDVIVGDHSRQVVDFREEIKKAYEQNIFDHNIEPMVILEGDQPIASVQDNDALIFFNYRPDRARQMTEAFVLPKFDKFQKNNQIQNLNFVAMTPYAEGLPMEVAFTKEEVRMTLAETLSKAGLNQLHIAETEKYAHITCFFDGNRENPFPQEDYVLIRSQQVEDYATVPEMSAYEVTDRVISEIKSKKYGFIVINFANPDMVAHTGNIAAAKLAVEAADKCLGRIIKIALTSDAVVLVTSDHGNAEEMLDLQRGTVQTGHTKNPVPFVIVAKEFEGKGSGKKTLYQKGDGYPTGLLSDVAPTILKFLDVPKPSEMTGVNLVKTLVR